MNDALTKMLNEIQQIRNTYSTGGVGNVSQAETNALRAIGINNQSDIEYMRANNNTGGVGNVSNQEMQMFNEMLNNAPTGGSSVGNMSDIEYMRANNPVVSAFGNVSDRENITLQEMIDVIGRQRSLDFLVNPYVFN
tara:strand:- start:187 stop:597 length:411 start_codon:yes stop_codon:yes gene_type:complete